MFNCIQLYSKVKILASILCWEKIFDYIYKYLCSLLSNELCLFNMYNM